MINSYLEAHGDQTMNTHWRKFYDALCVKPDKLAHQPCKQGQQMLDSFGVREPQIARLVGHKLPGSIRDNITVVQGQSYLTTPPIKAVVAVAGGNHRLPECHNPGWCYKDDATQQLLDCLVLAVIPIVSQTHVQITRLFDEAVSYQEQADNRLFMVLGVISYIKFAIEHAFLMLAAQRVKKMKGVWKVQTNENALIDQANASHNIFFSHGVFRTADFMSLKAKVADNQDREMERLVHMPLGMQTALGHHLTQGLVPQFAALDEKFNEVQVLRNQVTAVAALLEELKTSNTALSNEVRHFLIANAMVAHYNQPANAPNATNAPVNAPNAPNVPPANAPNAPNALPVNALNALPAIAPPAIAPPGNPAMDLDKDGLPPVPPNPPINLTNNNQTIQDYWTDYNVGRHGVLAFKKWEQKFNRCWRLNVSKTFWNKRCAIYGLVVYYKTAGNGMSDNEAMAAADLYFQRGQTNGRRNVVRSNKACRDQLATFGIDGKALASLLRRYDGRLPPDALLGNEMDTSSSDSAEDDNDDSASDTYREIVYIP
jgi:Transcriptional activator of glycolytic enzymes